MLKTSFGVAVMLVVVLSVAVPALAGQGCGGCAKGCGGGPGHGKGRAAGKGMHRGGASGAHHENIHSLLDRHEAISRNVEEIEGGVITVTTSEDPEVTRTIRAHVRQMQQRLESGHGMRWWDPLFAELFRHSAQIDMQIDDVPGGVKVRETSTDPQVVHLIRAHALRAVSEFVADGYERAHRPTELPDGYESPAAD